MPSYINIEDRYRLSAIRQRQQFNSGLTAAAIVAGGAIIGAGISAGGTMYASNQSTSAANAAARAQAAAGGDYAKAVQNALNQYNQTASAITGAIQAINPNIQVPNYSLLPTPAIFEKHTKGKLKGQIKTDKKGNPIIKQEARRGAVLESIEASNIINQNALRQIETVVPGSAQARAQANQIATNWQTALEQEFDRSKETYKLLESSRRLVEQQLPQLGSARAVVDKLIAGDLSEQAKNAITRTIAETAGAGFAPEAARRTAFGQTPQAALSQNIMREVEARQLRGLEAAQGITSQTLGLAGQFGAIGQQYGQTAQLLANISESARAWEGTRQSWQQMANNFITPTTAVMQIGLTGRGQDITKEQYGIQNALEQQRIQADMAIAALNAATGGAGATYQASTGATSSRLAASQAAAPGMSGAATALGTGVSQGAMAYGQYSAAQPVTYGTQYGSLAAAQQAAPYASGYSNVSGMGYVPRATAV